MAAADDLWEYIHSMDHPKRVEFDGFLEHYAHELAEQIRAHNFNPAGGAEPYDVADYIDPEVS